MDLRPTIIIVSLLATLVLVAVVAGLCGFYRARRRRGMRGSQIEEGDMSVRKFIIWKGRVVPDYLKPSVIADRARTWTDRPSWLLRDFNQPNTRSRGQRQPSDTPPAWPISKYNPMSQHNLLSTQVEYSERRHEPRKVREPGGASMWSNNKLQTGRKTPIVRAPEASVAVAVAVDDKAWRVLGGKSGSSSTAQARKLARSLERAYDVPSPHTRSKVNISTPTIVITQDFFSNHHHRSKEKLVGNVSKNRVNRRSMRTVPPGSKTKDPPPPPRTTSSTLQPPIKSPSEDASQRRRLNGLRSANGTPLASSDTLPTKSPITSPTRRPLRDFPQPPTAHSANSQTPRPYRALARSQNTVRRKRHTNPTPTHRPAKRAATMTGPPASSDPSVLDLTTSPAKGAPIESPSNHSRTSSKSLATFASSDISDAYTLGRAMPVPIIPTSMSRTVLDRVMGREKPLPRLPVAEDLKPEREVQSDIGEGETKTAGVEVRGGAAGPTTRNAIEG